MWLMAGLNVAVTLWLPLNVTVHVEALPPQPPVQPPNMEKVAGAPGVAVSVTGVLAGKVALQVVGQLIPAGELVTVPDALPLSETLS